MKYYSVSVDRDYTDAPKTVNWYGRIDIESVMNCKYEQLEDTYALEVKGNCELYRTDIIMDPIFAVSPMVKHCMEVYEPNMTFTSLYLVQRKEEQILEYFIPHLTEEKCLESKSGNVRSMPMAGKTVLNLNKVAADKFIFRAAEARAKHIIMRDVFLESILRRGAN